MEVLGRAQVDMRDAPDARVDLEVALVRLARPELDESPEALLERLGPPRARRPVIRVVGSQPTSGPARAPEATV